MRVCLVLLLLVSRAWSFDTSFWVWNHAPVLAEKEAAELRAQNVRDLFWRIGELENVDGAWRWKMRNQLPSVPAGFTLVPVVRLSSSVREPFDENGTRSLLVRLAELSCARLQLDMDCPDRLLDRYADVLQKIRARVPELSITALAGWSALPAFDKLQMSVVEIAPMFYDLETDPIGAEPWPLLDPQKIRAQLAAWSRCQIPWRAGLPNFARVTSYAADGKARGHLRDFSWTDLCFNRALTTLTSAHGVTTFRVENETRLASVALAKGEKLAARWPERAALAEAISAAKSAGACGVIFFRLPDETDASGWSLAQLSHLEAAPQLVLRRDGSRLALTNESKADLAPRLAGHDPLDRGYALEIDAPATIFREALPGDFWRVTAHAHPEQAPAPVAPPLATRLTFWFSHLRAGGTLRSGLIQLAPGADFSQIRYRFLPAEPNDEWKKIE